jgi:hypothetical protein
MAEREWERKPQVAIGQVEVPALRPGASCEGIGAVLTIFLSAMCTAPRESVKRNLPMKSIARVTLMYAQFDGRQP